MKLAIRTLELLGTVSFIELIRRQCRLTKEQHGGDPLAEEAIRHGTEEEPPQPSALNAAQEVDLVEFSRESRYPAVVWYSLGKAYQLTLLVFDNKTKPIWVSGCECLSPLRLT